MTSVSRDAFTTAKPADPFAGRAAPYAVEAEQAVLCAMLQSNEAVLRAAESLHDWMFYKESHRRLYRAMTDLARRSEVVDAVTLRNELDRKGELDAAGGVDYLSYLLDVVPSAANFDYHANIVRDKAVLRRLVEAATGIIQDVYEGRGTAGEVLDNAEHRVFQVAAAGQLVAQRDRIDDVGALREGDHRPEQQAMALAVEHRVVQELGGLEGRVLVEQHRAQHRLLRLVAPRSLAAGELGRPLSCRGYGGRCGRHPRWVASSWGCAAGRPGDR